MVRTRREVVRDVLRDGVPDLAGRALFDIGCGSGGLLAFLAESGVAVAGACDVYPESLALARQRVAAPLLLVDEGGLLPLGAGQTLLSLFDVLEHIDDDLGTLRHLAAGFRVRRLAHFMAPLVPLVALRRAGRALPGRPSAMERREAELNVTPVLNGLMRALLRLERPAVRAGALPFGTSLVAVAERSGCRAG